MASSLHGSFAGKLEINSPADRFFKFFTDDINSHFDKIAEEEIDSMDPEKKTVTMRMSGCLITDCYKTVKATITVTHKEDGNGSKVVWTVESEKIRYDINDPHLIIDAIIDALINYVKETDENLLP